MVCGFIAIRQANAELDRLQIHIDMEKPLEYDSELRERCWCCRGSPSTDIL